MKKKFDFEDKTKTATVIDCMDCEHYYTGACDARAGGCNSYEPTRKITMAEDIKTIKNLCWGNYIIGIGFAVAFITLCVRLIIASL